jgi:aconitase A
MTRWNTDILDSRRILAVGGIEYTIHRLNVLEKAGIGEPSALPFTLKVMLENLLRNADRAFVQPADIEALAGWDPVKNPDQEIAFSPSRILMQDFTGVPAIVDLAAMRAAVKTLGGDPQKINPKVPVDLIIDHSVQVDRSGDSLAFRFNTDKEYERNRERYAFLRWGQASLQNFRVVPPGTGICHQVNLEYLGQVVFSAKAESGMLAYPDTQVGTDPHTTMINGLGILAWGVGGIEAEAAMRYREEGIPLIVLAGKEYGTGSSRDWAAKGTRLLGVKAVIAESFERIHRSNLIGMGVLPLQFFPGDYADSLGLTGLETYAVTTIAEDLRPGKKIQVSVTDESGTEKTFSAICRVDTPMELDYYRHGGILPYVIRR